ncbi:MAG: phosphoglycerate mutase family protein, partial [Acidimicrobiales bacterium]|nr:phosphoglycerate mutase family protein [Acidimicrobiales bacterium]
MTRLYLVRHGRAAAGWDTHPDPGLDSLGLHQAEQMADQLAPLGPFGLISSPLQRCRETAAVLGARWNIEARIEPMVAEIPSPEGVPMGERVDWLRGAMSGTWTALGPRYAAFRDGVAECLLSLQHDT